MPNKKRKNSESNNQSKQANPNQGVPLSGEEQKQAQAIEQQIQGFEQQLEQKSNSQLKEISTRFETVEREMLLEKIDNELHTIKDTIVKPGDTASTAAAGTSAAAAVAINNTND